MNFFINTKKKKQGAEMGRFRSGVRDQGARQLILNCNNNPQYYCFYSLIDQINATLV